MIIDINMHHLPEDLFTNEKILDGFLSTAPRSYGEIASLGTIPETGKRQIILEKPKGYQNLNYVEGDYSLEAKLQAMDDNGVDKAILRVPVWQEWLKVDTCKIVNDNAAEMCKRSAGRLYATACVPPWGGKDNLYELERCVKDLGMVGVQLACHYGQLYLDDEAFKPYMKVLNELNVPVVVHHTPLPVYWQSVYEYTNLRRELGRIIDQATAVGRELFSGMFEEFPNLKFIHTMFGGNWFANYNLLMPHKGKKEEAMLRLDISESDRIKMYLKNNIYFDMTHPASWGKDQVECAIKVCGADHVLFGSSFPVFYNWMSQGIECVKSLDITEKERELITSGNAIRLFKLDV
ncbi:amidohydrolase 2 [Desulfitobacterium hafniense DCB-2]|uniref:Amidohydrolase 2 n=1 Tax=Desulfitobacterium hafniense (strain DSM 10664 / DCB-2) TaxID=272564 RepID=B8FQI4_DESHD|nr:amidohydrolase family protein [Desulfitobacterium hafniense]ACL19874.1 amidohydrolase 2 [Desulfitobacterium hafniense DCB-2]